MKKLKAKNLLNKIEKESGKGMFWLGAWVMANVLGLIK